MEGSVAAGAPAVDGGAQETASSGVDFTPLMEHLDGRLESFGQQLRDELAPAPEPQEPVDEWAEEFGHLFPDPAAEVEPQAQQQESQALAALQALAQRTQGQDQVMQQLAQEVSQMRLQSEVSQLVEQYPELNDPGVSQQVADETARFAAEIGMPQLAGSPRLAGLVYRASRADALAQSGVPAGGDAHVQLEVPGGAGQAPAADENVGQRIVQSMGGGGLWGRDGL